MVSASTWPFRGFGASAGTFASRHNLQAHHLRGSANFGKNRDTRVTRLKHIFWEKRDKVHVVLLWVSGNSLKNWSYVYCIYIYNHPDNHCFCLEANFFCWSKRIDLSPQPFSGWQPFLGLFWKCGHAWKHHLSVNRTYWNRKKCSSWRNLLIEFQATTLSYQAVKTPTIPGILGIWNWTIFISSIQQEK